MKRMIEKSEATGIRDKLLKASHMPSAMFEDSEAYKGGFNVRTNIGMLNLALSGRLDRGLSAGVHVIAGPTKCFKTFFSLIICAAYLKKYPDAVMIFYDSEFGAPKAYMESAGIDISRVIHIPVPTIEDLKFDIVQKLNTINRGEHVIFFLDSVGNIASNKEVDDAIDKKSKADMTRAKAIKSLFRIITPHFQMKDLAFVCVNHTYKSQGDMYPVDIVSGGTGIQYSANSVWVINKSQNKTDGELQGFEFKIKIDKSRFVREKSVFPITVDFDGGVRPFSGLFDLAMEFGWVKEAKKGFYNRYAMNDETGELVLLDDKNWRKTEADKAEFWKGILDNALFSEMLSKNFEISQEDVVSKQSVESIGSFLGEE